MKFDLILADPPWSFSDKLTMQNDKQRGSASQYDTMSTLDICNLQVQELSTENALLALWTPSSLLDNGLQVMNAWGFNLKTTVIWVKTNKNFDPKTDELEDSTPLLMGNYFRGSHEMALIGTRGKMASEIKNHSQKSVIFSHSRKHSEKPTTLHTRLELMLPNANKLELFGRRQHKGWTVIGNQSPDTLDEDITKSIAKLIVK